jgi:hypothetical protein
VSEHRNPAEDDRRPNLPKKKPRNAGLSASFGPVDLLQ